MNISFREIQFGSPEYEESVKLRDRILRIPIGLTFSEVDLVNEVHQHHLAACKRDSIIGILILVPMGDDVKMRQVAVDGAYQGKGIGGKLVQYAEEFAIQKGFKRMVLNARKTARKFYLNLDYRTDDIEFHEVGIPHVKMWKDLD